MRILITVLTATFFLVVSEPAYAQRVFDRQQQAMMQNFFQQQQRAQQAQRLEEQRMQQQLRQQQMETAADLAQQRQAFQILQNQQSLTDPFGLTPAQAPLRLITPRNNYFQYVHYSSPFYNRTMPYHDRNFIQTRNRQITGGGGGQIPSGTGFFGYSN